MPRHLMRGKVKRAGESTGKCLKKAAWKVCKVVIIVSCWPCLCFLTRGRHNRRGRCGGGRCYEEMQPPVPYPRERALTIPSTDWREDQSTVDQPRCLFMTRLPLEIRRMVYEHALGGASIYLVVSNGILWTAPCRLPDCRCGNNRSPKEKKLDFALPLLRTCRVM